MRQYDYKKGEPTTKQTLQTTSSQMLVAELVKQRTSISSQIKGLFSVFQNNSAKEVLIAQS